MYILLHCISPSLIIFLFVLLHYLHIHICYGPPDVVAPRPRYFAYVHTCQGIHFDVTFQGGVVSSVRFMIWVHCIFQKPFYILIFSRNYYFSITYHTYRSSSHMYLYFPAVTSHFIRNRVPERFLIFLLFFAVMIRQYNDKIYIDISKSWYLVSYSWVSFGRGWVLLHGICPYVYRMGTSYPSNRLVNRVGPPKGPIAFVDLSSSALYVRILSRFEFIEIHN